MSEARSFLDLPRVERREALRFGVPNQGRLRAEVREALDWKGWGSDSRSLTFRADGILVVLARSTDLPRLVASGALDACVSAHDYVVESGTASQLRMVKDLGIQRTKLCVVRRDDDEELEDVTRSLTVVSQYPNIASDWIRRHPLRRRMTLVPIDGAAEVFVSLGMADLAIDAVMPGLSLEANGMRIAECLFESSGRIYRSRRIAKDARALQLLTGVTARMDSALR